MSDNPVTQLQLAQKKKIGSSMDEGSLVLINTINGVDWILNKFDNFFSSIIERMLGKADESHLKQSNQRIAYWFGFITFLPRVLSNFVLGKQFSNGVASLFSIDDDRQLSRITHFLVLSASLTYSVFTFTAVFGLIFSFQTVLAGFALSLLCTELMMLVGNQLLKNGLAKLNEKFNSITGFTLDVDTKKLEMSQAVENSPEAVVGARPDPTTPLRDADESGAHAKDAQNVYTPSSDELAKGLDVASAANQPEGLGNTLMTLFRRSIGV